MELSAQLYQKPVWPLWHLCWHLPQHCCHFWKPHKPWLPLLVFQQLLWQCFHLWQQLALRCTCLFISWNCLCTIKLVKWLRYYHVHIEIQSWLSIDLFIFYQLQINFKESLNYFWVRANCPLWRWSIKFVKLRFLLL